MRALLLSATLLFLLAQPAAAAIAWTEAEENGRTVTRWTQGADLNEVFTAVRASVGPDYRVLEVCRQPGFFAFVGSPIESQRGVSCGFATQQAALYAARNECEVEGGRCDFERIGHDEGESLLADKQSRLPDDLPGSTHTGGDLSVPTGPMTLQ